MKTSNQKSKFGKLADGKTADLYTLTNANGLVAKITNFGATVTELHVPDKEGKLTDVVLGFDHLDGYLKGSPYFGSTVGRVGNRIARARFTLEGKTYTLAANNGRNHLHGGIKGFDKVLWKAQAKKGAASVAFTYTSPDGEEGYPGKLDVTVVMTLSDANELRLDYTAVTDKPTPVNLTNHSYFNLAGAGDVLSHDLMLAADGFTASDAELIPTGEIKPVKGTPLDFTTAKPIGSRFSGLKSNPVGYDDNFVLNSGGKSLALAARVHESVSGRVMEVLTTEPGIQLYTGNFLDGTLTGKGGAVYRQHAGLCLETQHFPDAVNQPKFPSIILRPGQTYQQTTIYKFGTK
jgi:aldose 1-epimerase